ncbi:hypothetical protein PGT21_026703 [Puccinia graminis f. sp. tritici]|uniref:Uncharacterized protein n=1 Tax=Puccinia graminis f. sp. tritici TaxID=56615 RepID=A0A5B0NZD9_PUCGR|nr:hypothetical protein PGT21_026703 [Puccinia graminis f. sp. tritici]KAA1135038.1 hypothetical protein PGTUg99_014450 [Puccinia graminis f. sp. tritici]
MKLSNSIKQQIVVAIQLCWLSSALNGAPMIEKLKCCFCGARDPKPIGSGAEVENPSTLQNNPTVIKPHPNFAAPSDLPVFPVVSNLPHAVPEIPVNLGNNLSSRTGLAGSQQPNMYPSVNEMYEGLDLNLNKLSDLKVSKNDVSQETSGNWKKAACETLLNMSDNFNPISESGSNGSNGSIYPSMTSLSKPVSKPSLVAPTATTIETKYNSHAIQDTNQPPTAFQATAVDMQSRLNTHAIGNIAYPFPSKENTASGALGMGHIMDGMGENNLDIGPLYPQVHMPNGQNFPRPISGTNLFNFVTPYQGNHASSNTALSLN